MHYKELSMDQLQELIRELTAKHEEYKAQGLKLNMARGKPAPDQLKLTEGMLKYDFEGDYCASDGTDCRNYGVLDGIPEAKELMRPMLGVGMDEIIVGGNSSLQLMYDCIMTALHFGVPGGKKPWGKYDRVKFLCPAPGYDRHFAICESLGIEMITVPYTNEGPDMDMVEKLVSEDEEVKGIWCVPMYSNPTGISYSDSTVKRFAALKPKADDFRIFWDNAYCIHHLTDDHDVLLNLLDECKKNGTEDLPLMFASTSKVSFPGAGIACIGASKENIDFIKSKMTYQTIGFDKLNQLRHVRFFKDFDGMCRHMELHRAIIAPKFNIVTDMLSKEIGPHAIGGWHTPKGGYFISFTGFNGTAKRIVSLCKEAGVVLTGAGATYPYHNDPYDNNIRIAPTFPSEEELTKAMEIFCNSVKLATAEKILEI